MTLLLEPMPLDRNVTPTSNAFDPSMDRCSPTLETPRRAKRFVAIWRHRCRVVVTMVGGAMIVSNAHAGLNEWTPVGPVSLEFALLSKDGRSGDLFAAISGSTQQTLFRSRSAGVSFTRIAPPPQQPARCFDYQIPGNGSLYAQAARDGCRGLFRSDDNGGSWSEVTEPVSSTPIASLTPGPEGTSTLYGLVFGIGAFKSNDGGASWTALPTGWPQFGLSRVVVDPKAPSTLYISGLRSVVMKSIDGGTTWNMSNVGLPAPDTSAGDIVGFVAFDDKLALATVGAGIFVSTDEGASWAPSNAGIGNTVLAGLARSDDPTPVLYTYTHEFIAPVTVYRSSDAGVSWTQQGTIDSHIVRGLAVNARNSSVVHAMTHRGLAVSVDAGRTWGMPTHTGLAYGRPLRIFGDAGDALQLYAAPREGADVRSVDGGLYWEQLENQVPSVRIVATSETRAGVVYGMCQGFCYSEDNGVTWSRTTIFVGSTIDAVADGGPSSAIVYVAGNTRFSSPLLYRSTDNGANWVRLVVPVSPLKTIALDPTNVDTLYVSLFDGLYKTTNGGTTWENVGSALPAAPVVAVAISPANSNNVYALMGSRFSGPDSSGVWASTNGGASWVPSIQGVAVGAAINSLAMDRSHPFTLYVGTAGKGIYWSNDGGVTWQPFNAGLRTEGELRVNEVIVDRAEGRRLYAATDAGVFAFEFDALGTRTSVVEFYNSTLDHYFITADANEVRELDTGVHFGWQRTGQTFNARPPGNAAASPVCRFYIPPPFGSSHFYSASSAECVETGVKYPVLVLESSDVFRIGLPEASTGTCQAGDLPLYRVWNARADSNHRYTPDIVARDLMAATGAIAEGYGPNAVIMCSPR